MARLPWPVGALCWATLALGCGETTSSSPQNDVPFGAQCTRQRLADLCAREPCPASPEDVPLECQYTKTYRYSTHCGGTAVVRGTSPGVSWFFDASGALIGRTLSSDVGSNSCGGPGLGKTTVWGEACDVDQQLADLCSEACPATPCVPEAHISADFPLALHEAEPYALWACREEVCLAGRVSREMQLGLASPLQGGGGVEQATVTFATGFSTLFQVELVWSLPPGDFAQQQHYRVWLDPDSSDTGDLPVLETDVLYDLVDLGCAGQCRIGSVDLRAPRTGK